MVTCAELINLLVMREAAERVMAETDHVSEAADWLERLTADNQAAFDVFDEAVERWVESLKQQLAGPVH